MRSLKTRLVLISVRVSRSCQIIASDMNIRAAATHSSARGSSRSIERRPS